MARGWESKSVEAQIEAARENRSASTPKHPHPVELERVRKKESLLLSLTRVRRELETCRNPRYKVVLTKALTDLNARLAELEQPVSEPGKRTRSAAQ